MIGMLLTREKIDPADVIISNKLGWYQIPLKTPELTFEPGAWAGISYDAFQKISYRGGILECWEQGNELLGGKYMADLLFVHDPDEYLLAATSDADWQNRLNEILEAYHALFELKEKGEIKAVGIGSKDWLIVKKLNNYLDFDWVMFANKFTIYHHPKEIISFMDELQKKGTGIINSAVFNAGFLIGGRFFDYVKVKENDPAFRHLLDWRSKFHMICRDFGIKPADACIKFGISHPAICSIALNTSNPGKMPENVNTIRKDLPGEFWNALKEMKVIDPEYQYL